MTKFAVSVKQREPGLNERPPMSCEPFAGDAAAASCDPPGTVRLAQSCDAAGYGVPAAGGRAAMLEPLLPLDD